MKRISLAQRRRTVGLTQEMLAEQLGVDRTTIIRWETGISAPLPWHRPNMAMALKVSVEELAVLLGDVDGPRSDSWNIPVPIEILWPELRDDEPSAHPAERTLKELSIFLRSECATRYHPIEWR